MKHLSTFIFSLLTLLPLAAAAQHAAPRKAALQKAIAGTPAGETPQPLALPYVPPAHYTPAQTPR